MNIVFESSTSEGVKESVIAGIGVSFISNLAIKREVSLRKLKIIKIDGFSIIRDFYAVYQKNRILSNPAKVLLEKLIAVSAA
jgi:DNA-binding transcriptional LysR family regulator